MHIMISCFYEYHDLVYKILKLVVLVTKMYFYVLELPGNKKFQEHKFWKD